MRVLLLGPAGQLGSAILPALLAHKHTVTVLIRPFSVSKLPSSLLPSITVFPGDASSVTDIKKALTENNCDALVSSAGNGAMFSFSKAGTLEGIFKAVVTAAVEVGKERGGKPLRCWMLAGFGAMDAADSRYVVIDYLPVYPEHKRNIAILQALPKEDLIWSVLCPSVMAPRAPGVEPKELVVKADSPPEWTRTMLWIPFLGGYLNAMLQFGKYTTTLEDNGEVIAKDLDKGMESEFAWKKVTGKEPTKKTA